MPGDAQDWTGIAGSTRFLGAVHIPDGTNQIGSLDFTPQPYDGAILAMPDTVIAASDAVTAVNVFCLTLGVLIVQAIYGNGIANAATPFVSPVSLEMDSRWQVQVQRFGTYAFSANWYLFAVPSFPTVLASVNGAPLPVQVVSAGGLYPGSGLPVAPARASLSATSLPGAGGLATLTFPATAGRTYSIASVASSFQDFGAVAAQGAYLYVRDGLTGVGAVLWGQFLAFPSVVGSIDHNTPVGPITGTTGNAMTVEFSVAIGNVLQSISASVYF